VPQAAAALPEQTAEPDRAAEAQRALAASQAARVRAARARAAKRFSRGSLSSPSELVFAVVQQTQSAPQTLTLKNPSTSAAKLGSIVLDQPLPGTGSFELVSAPQAGTDVAARYERRGADPFSPERDRPNFKLVLIETTSPAAKLKIGLFGLGTKGLEGANEPFLKAVLDTLGFAVNVGGAGLFGHRRAGRSATK